MTTTELIEAIKTKFEEAISKKTGWGKNEIMVQFDKAVATASLEALSKFVDKL